MISFFPDLNVWLALSVASHSHNDTAWSWLQAVPADHKLILSRYTQIGLLRLLTNSAVMGAQTLTLREAWGVYDRWLEDSRVDFYPEPRYIETAFRRATKPFAARPASKSIGDCWLLAYAQEIQATLVTFDRALYEFARNQDCSAAIPV